MTLPALFKITTTSLALAGLIACGKEEREPEPVPLETPEIELPVVSDPTPESESEAAPEPVTELGATVLPSKTLGQDASGGASDGWPQSMEDAEAMVHSVAALIDAPDQVEPRATARHLRRAADFIRAQDPVEDRREQSNRDMLSTHLTALAARFETATEVEDDDDKVRLLGQLKGLIQMYMPE